MIEILIGILTGLLIAIIILLIEILLKSRGGTLIERIEDKVRPIVQKKGAIIEPLDQLSESIIKKIEKDEKEGKDTHLEDL